MNHRTTPRFWKEYDALPAEVQRLADRAFETLKTDPYNQGLHLKRIGPLWSARVGLHHRALAVDRPDGLTWIWIGTHAEYDRRIGQLSY